jgi:hypothetical protein
MDFENIREMITAILYYVKEHPGRVIVSADVPEDLLYGFTIKDIDPFLLNRPTWRIKCKSFRVSVKNLPERACEILTEYFQSALGRQLMARLLTNGMRSPELSSLV